MLERLLDCVFFVVGNPFDDAPDHPGGNVGLLIDLAFGAGFE